jgi:hypothetical protein
MTVRRVDEAKSRILLGLDAGLGSASSIAAATALAQLHGAELVGMFVEEAVAEEGVALPAKSMVAPSGGTRRMDPLSLRRSMRALVSLRREELLGRAKALELRCSFEVSRGSLTRELLSVAVERDLIVLGHSTRRGPQQGLGVVVLVRRGNDAARSIELARELAHGELVSVWLSPVVAESGAVKVPLDADAGVAQMTDADRLGEALRQRRARLVVVQCAIGSADEAFLRTLRGRLACPMVAFR